MEDIAINNPPVQAVKNVQAVRIGRVIYFIVGIIEVLLAFRFVFKLLGANPNSPFVAFIYGFSNIFYAPFAGIFSRATTRGAETTAIFEPSTLIAMFVYAVLGWGIIKLLIIVLNPSKRVEAEL